MKRFLTVLAIALMILPGTWLFASGQNEGSTGKMIIRGAEQVPNLISPPVWDGQAFSLDSSIYDYLIEMDANTGKLVPALATDWNSPDGKVWTFHLRKGVKFHDGSDSHPRM